MTIELTPLHELDFPTPEIFEIDEAEITPQEIHDFVDYLDAEKAWREASIAEQQELIHQMMTRDYRHHLDLGGSCFCSPSRGSLLGGTSIDYCTTLSSGWNYLFGSTTSGSTLARYAPGPEAPPLRPQPVYEEDTPVGLIMGVIAVVTFITLAFCIFAAVA
jgi:hypothetical protein